MPLHHGEHLAERLPGAQLRIRPGEGHLGGLGASREVFDAIFGHWPGDSEVAEPKHHSEPSHVQLS